MMEIEKKLNELAASPEYKTALRAFLEAIRQDEKLIEIMIEEHADNE